MTINIYFEEIMKFLMLTPLLFLLGACATNKDPNQVVAVKAGDEYYQVDNAAARSLEGKTEDRVVCTRRSVVGSNKKQKVCTTQAEIDRDREAARDVMRKNEQIRVGREAAEKRGN